MIGGILAILIALWYYRTAEARAQGQPQGRNEPGELPAIGAVLAGLRGGSAR